MNSDLNKQAQSLEVTFSRKTKIISLSNLFQQYIKNLSELELEFLSSYCIEKYSNACKVRKSVLLD